MTDSPPPYAPSPAQPVAPVNGSPTTSVLSWVALGLGIVGFLLAILPVASFLAWLFTLPAFILSIIAMVQKGRKKVVPAIALPVSIVAFLIAIIVSVATIVGAPAANGPGDDDDTPTVGQGDESEADDGGGVTESFDDYPTFEPIEVSGSGDSVIELPADVTQGIVTATYSGSSNFSILGLDANNESTGDLLVNTIGRYSGVTVFGLSAFGDAVRLEVSADDDWTAVVAPIASAPELTFPASGKGDAVYLFEGAAASWTISYEGDGNFAVIQYDDGSIPNLAVNEIGSYSGTMPMRGGPAVIVISADDDWRIAQ